MSTPACKEWAVVVRALLAGEQLLDVRKGGIREEGRHFRLRAHRFWLYPTVEHQEPELLKPAYRHWVAETVAAAPPDRAVRIEGWADVTGVVEIDDADELAKIDSKLIWTHEYVASRLAWKRKDPLIVLALRAHRLVEPIVVPFRDDYAGCTSWVDLEGLPDDPASVTSEPAVSDESYSARIGFVEGDLGRTLSVPD